MIFQDNKSEKKITTKDKTPPRYAKTQQILADILGMDRSVLSGQYLSLDGAPKKGKAGYNVKHCEEWIKTCKESRLQGDGSLKDEKLLREIEMLDIKIKQITGELVDHKETRLEYLRKLNRYRSIIDNWASHQTAKYPSLAVEIDQVRNELIEQMASDET